ncbi:group XIIA secretory phospholipase A2-like, partial [Tachysurus ichikawai]
CELAVTLLFSAIERLGCKPYLTNQSDVCVCHKEEKTDL